MAKRPVRTHCPISFALDLFGDKWSLLILRDLLLKGKKTYQEFLEAGEGISTNILADRLIALKEFGFIEKRDDPDNGRQVIYSPTKMAIDLLPMLLELIRWSYRYDPKTLADKEFVDQVRNDRMELERRLRKSLVSRARSP